MKTRDRIPIWISSVVPWGQLSVGRILLSIFYWSYTMGNAVNSMFCKLNYFTHNRSKLKSYMRQFTEQRTFQSQKLPNWKVYFKVFFWQILRTSLCSFHWPRNLPTGFQWPRNLPTDFYWQRNLPTGNATFQLATQPSDWPHNLTIGVATSQLADSIFFKCPIEHVITHGTLS